VDHCACLGYQQVGEREQHSKIGILLKTNNWMVCVILWRPRDPVTRRDTRRMKKEAGPGGQYRTLRAIFPRKPAKIGVHLGQVVNGQPARHPLWLFIMKSKSKWKYGQRLCGGPLGCPLFDRCFSLFGSLTDFCAKLSSGQMFICLPGIVSSSRWPNNGMGAAFARTAFCGSLFVCCAVGEALS